MNLPKFNASDDVFYQKDYINLYINEGDEIFEFRYDEGRNVFYNASIKRAIKNINVVKIEDGYFDLEGAYGYGGFYASSYEPTFLAKALDKYKQKCIDENIIAEFIRFNPFNNFAKNNTDIFDMCIMDRQTIFLDLNKNYDEIRSGFSQNLHRNLKKISGLTFKKLDKTLSTAQKFLELYAQTMTKNQAGEFYFFNLEYFLKIFKLGACEIYGVEYENELINMVIILNQNHIIYYHLGATNTNFYHLNSNAFMFDCIIKLFLKQDKILYLGGGTNGDSDNSLFMFKRKFSKSTLPFYIAGKIYNEKIYKKYCQIWQEQSQNDIKMFLKYRAQWS